MYRRDPALTAESPLRGGLADAPSLAWSFDLGGPPVVAESILVRDVTGDGTDEFLALGADTVTCRDHRGHVLWKLENVLNPTVVEILDFAGNGSRGILLTASRAGKVDTHMVDGRSGQMTHLWRDENSFGGQTRVGRLLSDVAGLQIAASASGQTPPAPQGGDFRLVSFERGLADPHFRVRQRVEGIVFAPLILFADLDGDGRDEFVAISHEQIWAFDPRDGGQTFYAPYGPSIRTYWATIAAVKLVPTDACPSLVMINPFLPGLKAVAQDGRTFAREIWKVVIGGSEDQYQSRVSVEPAGTSLVYDLHNDGRYVVPASITNEHGDGETRLAIFEALTGRRLAELPEARVLAADDLDGDGQQELLLQRGSHLHLCRWSGHDLLSVWDRADVQPVLRPFPLEGDRTLSSPNVSTLKGNSAVWRTAAESTSFLLRFPDGVFSCRLVGDEVECEHEIVEHEALGNRPSVHPDAPRVTWDQSVLTTTIHGREVYRYQPPTPKTYLAPPPLVADLGGSRQILVRDAAGDFLAISSDGKRSRVLIRQLNEPAGLLADPHGVGPAVCDVDGDGEQEIVATIQDTDGRPACVFLDGNGIEKRRLELVPGMAELSRGPMGRLGTGRGRWVLLRMFGEGPDHERIFQVIAYDGQTGEQLWVRRHYGHYGTNPVKFVAHFPSAVWDYDGDGADDWIVVSENFYGILNVRENRDLVGPVVLSDSLDGHWTAYTFPSIATSQPEAEPVVFHHNAYSLALVTDLEGNPMWHYGMTRDTAGRWGHLVDVDGDGRHEVLHVQPDGVLRCFTAASPSRCPTCPPDVELPSGQDEAERWQFDLGRPISRLIAADLDGDGRTEVLFGGDDGKLHALGERDRKPYLLWSVDLGRRVGEPILVDADGDRCPEILVPVEDGRIYCLKGTGLKQGL